MVSVIPQTGLSDLLGMGLGQGINQTLSHLVQQKMNKQDLSGFSPIFQKLGYDPSMLEGLSKSGAKPAEIIDLLKVLGAMSAGGGEDEKMREETGQQLKELKEGADYAGTAIFGGVKPTLGRITGTNASRKVEELKNLGILTADKIFTHFNKGTISKEKLNLIVKELAPNPKSTRAEYLGRIDALERLMQLPKDASYEDVKKQISEKKSNQAPIMARNPKTGETIQSSDGGKTWQKIR